MASTRPGFVRRKPLLITLLVVIILALAGIVGWDIYQKRAIAAEKAKFAQAEQEIDKLSADIIAVTGQPLKVEKKKFCSRPNLKYREGPLSCNVDIDQFYITNNTSTANVLLQQSTSVIQGKWLYINNQNNILFESASDENYQKLVFRSKSSNHNLLCDVIYQYFDKVGNPYTDVQLAFENKFVVGISLSCQDSAKIAHYSITT